MQKITKIYTIITVIVVLISAVNVYGAFHFSAEASAEKATLDQKSEKVQELRSEIRRLKDSGTSAKDSPEREIDEASDGEEGSSDEAAAVSESCLSLSPDDEATVAGWEPLDNNTYSYEMKYPGDLDISIENEELVTLNNDEYTLQVGSERATEIGFADYTLVESSDVEIGPDCIPGTQSVFAFDADGRMVVTSVQREGESQVLLMFSYTSKGGSYDADMEELSDLFLKTFESK